MGGCYNYRTYNFFIFFNVVGTKQTRDQSKSRVVKGHKFGIGQKGMIGFVCQRSTVIGRTDEFWEKNERQNSIYLVAHLLTFFEKNYLPRYLVLVVSVKQIYVVNMI